MKADGLDVFDESLQSTHVRRDDLMPHRTIGPVRQAAWHALGTVLRPVRDRVPVGPSARLGAQLPPGRSGRQAGDFIDAVGNSA